MTPTTLPCPTCGGSKRVGGTCSRHGAGCPLDSFGCREEPAVTCTECAGTGYAEVPGYCVCGEYAGQFEPRYGDAPVKDGYATVDGCDACDPAAWCGECRQAPCRCSALEAEAGRARERERGIQVRVVFDQEETEVLLSEALRARGYQIVGDVEISSPDVGVIVASATVPDPGPPKKRSRKKAGEQQVRIGTMSDPVLPDPLQVIAPPPGTVYPQDLYDAAFEVVRAVWEISERGYTMARFERVVFARVAWDARVRRWAQEQTQVASVLRNGTRAALSMIFALGAVEEMRNRGWKWKAVMPPLRKGGEPRVLMVFPRKDRRG